MMNRRSLLWVLALATTPFSLFPFSLSPIEGPGAWAQAQEEYFPPPEDWRRRPPAEVGMDEAKLAEAVEFARQHETSRPRDYSDQVEIFGRPLGPLPKL